jgi:16S rRNA (cytosine1402-N4)-methyltransferase
LSEIPHIPVLYREVVELFSDLDSGIVIDCTLGYGGHSSLILESNPSLHVIGIDQDQSAIDFTTKRLEKYGERVSIKKGRFSDIISDILKEHPQQDIVGVLADIGVSSLQLDNMDRGFSYDSDTLDMRMNQDASFNAKDIVNSYSKEELANILFNYSDIKNSRQIAQAIVDNRPFYSSKELSDVVKKYAPKGKKIHPATLVFQAIRIEVNDELGELNRLLDKLKSTCLSHAKVAIISFHSLEDRAIKQRFNQWSKSCICDIDAFRCECGNDHDIGKVINKKPTTAQKDELKQNPRSSSAKLRVFQMNRECNE